MTETVCWVCGDESADGEPCSPRCARLADRLMREDPEGTLALRARELAEGATAEWGDHVGP
jgi:hypothetical protein